MRPAKSQSAPDFEVAVDELIALFRNLVKIYPAETIARGMDRDFKTTLISELLAEKPEDAVKFAAQDEVAEQVLIRFLAKEIECGHTLHPFFVTFLVNYLRGENRASPNKRGRPEDDGLILNVILAVRSLHKNYGFFPTRGDNNTTISGCDIVSNALMKAGLGYRSYGQIKRTWIKYKSIIPDHL
jgi:hypothetical protein